MRITWVRWVLPLLLGLSLAACGGEPLAFTSVPVYPQATALAEGENSIADAVLSAMQAGQAENLTSEVQMYSVPADSDFAAVKRFYDEQLAGSDWEAAGALASESETFSTAGWQRGGFGNEQMLMIGLIPPVLDSGAVLIVALFSE